MAFVPGYPVYMQPITNGSESKSVFLYITAGSGLPVTGLAYNTAGLLASYAGTKLARVAITLADLAAVTTAWSSGGFKEVDATNMPGVYRLDIPNAALALSADEVVITIVKDGTCQSTLIIPIPAKTIETLDASVGENLGANVIAIGDMVNTVQITDLPAVSAKLDVDAGTIGDVVDAIADGIPYLDVVATSTSRTDN